LHLVGSSILLYLIKVVINYSTCCVFIRTVVPCKLLVSLY